MLSAAHRGGQVRKLTHSVYIVAWHEDYIIKVGYTSGKRWSIFVNRGAELVARSTHPNARDAIYHETDLEAVLAARGEPAFRDRAESVAHVGHGGGGWTECYRVAPSDHAATLDLLRMYPIGVRLTDSDRKVERTPHSDRSPDLTRPDQTRPDPFFRLTVPCEQLIALPQVQTARANRSGGNEIRTLGWCS